MVPSFIAFLVYAERTKKEIISEGTYNQMFQLLHQLPPTCRHVVVLLTVPIVFPGTAYHSSHWLPSWCLSQLPLLPGIMSPVPLQLISLPTVLTHHVMRPKDCS